MKNFKTVLLIAAFPLFVFALNAKAEAPCHDKVEGKHAARKALQQCIESWAKDVRPTDVDPADDCTSKMSSFIQAAKDLKACGTKVIEERKEHQKKK